MHLAVVVGRAGSRFDELVVEALVVAFDMVVLEVFAEHASEMRLAEGNGVLEAVIANGADEPFGVRVQIRTSRWEADHFDPNIGEESAERGGVERIAVEDQEALAEEEAVEEVPAGGPRRDLRARALSLP